MYFEYRIVKIEKGLFLIEYKTAPYGVWHEVKDKKFKTKPKAEAWARKNLKIGNIVEYDNKIMVIKEPRDGSHFDLFCPKEGLVYCLVDIDEIKSVRITTEILEKNGWEKMQCRFLYYRKEFGTLTFRLFEENYGWTQRCENQNLIKKVEFVHELRHLLFGFGINHEMEV